MAVKPIGVAYPKRVLTLEEQNQKLEAENKRLKEKLRNFRKENKNLLNSNARLKVQVMNMNERVQRALKII
jgi:cell division protein FtsB